MFENKKVFVIVLLFYKNFALAPKVKWSKIITLLNPVRQLCIVELRPFSIFFLQLIFTDSISATFY